MVDEMIRGELQRVSSYTGVLATLAKDGLKTEIDTQQLQAIFADVANVTGWAYAHFEELNNPPDYKDKYDN